MTLDSNHCCGEQTLIKQSTASLGSETRDFALRAFNLSKFFLNGSNLFQSSKSKTVVLKSININVEKNKIYALLGPSGCGKTTLLKCLLGLLKYEHGKVFINQDSVCRKRKNKVNLGELGYMPQETCLYSELTVGEIFFYFGKLYSMPSKEINLREKFLIGLLNLPDSKHLIANMSGGQARRTSLAISLLNRPKILILDEPTVGLDPMLRKKIWDFLDNLAHRDNTTILITTHYIEETRGADCLGFMRAGQIIEENSPEFLIKKFNTQILEDIFYLICENQTKESTCSENFVSEAITEYHQSNKVSFGIDEIYDSYNVSGESKKKNIFALIDLLLTFIKIV